MSIGPAHKKQYGLIIPEGSERAPVKKRPLSSVFNVDSDEEGPAPSKEDKPGHLQKSMKRQARIDIQRALEEDSTVYQYDEIYDEMKEDKAKKVNLKKQDKTSKYAKNLIRNAAVRKLENDRHFERKCQRELEDEGDEFADKEAFVTSSYKKKLEELATLEEEHKRMEAEEARNDVTKRADLTDFYRNILSQRTENVAVPPLQAASTEPTASKEAGKEREGVSEGVSEPTKPLLKKARSDTQRSYRAKTTNAPSQATDSEGDSDASEEQTKPEDTGTAESHAATELESTKESDQKKVEDATKRDLNLDRDDPDSSSSEDEEHKKDDEKEDKEQEKEEEKKEENAGEDENIGEVTCERPPVRVVLSEEEEKALRLKLVVESCKKRNTPETIQAAVERYWKRKSAATAS